MTLRGPDAPIGASPASGSLSSALAGALSGASASTARGPVTISSLAELRAAIAAIPSYDGVVANVPGVGTRAVYRNRSMLITGRALLPFTVT